jgi:Acyclic terpene utilisation family protein AtuA
MIRIGNAQAFWGDRSAAAAELLSQAPELDYLTMDYLAEVSMSILAQQRNKQPHLGYPLDFIAVVRSLADYWSAGGRCRLIVNAGGLNPLGCAQACRQALEQAGCRRLKIGICSGDNVLELLRADSGHTASFRNLDDGRNLESVRDRLITANAYLGCSGIVTALNQGADIVITGRVADPSMVLAACVHAFNWNLDDWDRLAQGTVAGHLLECGTQVTGGISTDWLDVADPVHIGFPFVEIEADGRCIVTKAASTGGCVNLQTVKEQLVYEIGDPARYLSPDVQVSFLGLQLRQLDTDRVEVLGAAGSARPSTLKVSATYADGFRAAGTLTIIGDRASQKAQRSAAIAFQRLGEAGWSYREAIVECLGGTSQLASPAETAAGCDFETVLRVSIESDSEAAAEAFSREMIPLVTAGAQATTGYAEGRPRVHKVFRYWPCLIEADRTQPQVEFVQTEETLRNRTVSPIWPPAKPTAAQSTIHFATSTATIIQAQAIPISGKSTDHSPTVRRRRLIDVAFGRSGDKGTGANVGILVRQPGDYQWLTEWLTCDRVLQYFASLEPTGIERFELPNLGGVNFILRGVLRRSGRNDAQGKSLAQILLAMPLD